MKNLRTPRTMADSEFRMDYPVLAADNRVSFANKVAGYGVSAVIAIACFCFGVIVGHA